jgi:hypothetical protein
MSGHEDRHLEGTPLSVGDEGLVINTRLLAIERQQNKEKEEQRKYNQEQLKFNKWLAAFTALLFVTNVIADYLISNQLKVAQVSTNAAYLAVQEAKRSADAAESSLFVSRQAVNENKRALEQTINQNRESLKATLDQNKKALNINLAVSWLDQRPWVSVRTFQLAAEVEQGKELRFTLWLQNTGKTPAVDQTAQMMLFLWDHEPTFDDFKDPTIVSGEFNVPSLNSATWFTYRWTPRPESVADYRAKKLRLYVLALLRYKDMFQQSHLTRVCVFHVADAALDEIGFCSAGNSME